MIANTNRSATQVHEAYLTAPLTNLLNKVQLVICGVAYFFKAMVTQAFKIEILVITCAS